MKLVEWRSLAPEALTPLYRREESRWKAALHWDTATSWATIESARVTWGLPGFVCCDAAGAARGWTFFITRGDAIEVGGLFADSCEATAALVDGLLTHHPRALTGFVYATAPGLQQTLAERAIALQRYAYLTRATNRLPYEPPAHGLRAWRMADVDATAALLKDAYGPAGRLFASDDSLPQWRVYVENLLAYSGCGVLRPDLSRVVDVDGHAVAVALITSLASDTAHLAQLAVSPGQRRAGLARTLIADTLKSAHAAGYRRMSLLVSGTNTSARRLYGKWGFAECGEFLALEGAAH